MAAQNFLVSSMPSPHSLSIIEQLGISPATIARRGLREFAEADAKTLEWVETAADGCEHRLIPVAAAAWCALTAAAQADGLTLIMISSFRSVQRQAEIIHSKLAIGQTIDEILMSVAPPGYSEHHTGCAVDITSIDHPQLAITFEHTPEFSWLRQHATRFGFTLSFPVGNTSGYQYEPWHWCFHAF